MKTQKGYIIKRPLHFCKARLIFLFPPLLFSHFIVFNKQVTMISSRLVSVHRRSLSMCTATATAAAAGPRAFLSSQQQQQSCTTGTGSPSPAPPQYVGAIDQGTSSTRFIIFDKEGQVVSMKVRVFHSYFMT
jgi:hypothetical protein